MIKKIFDRCVQILKNTSVSRNSTRESYKKIQFDSFYRWISDFLANVSAHKSVDKTQKNPHWPSPLAAEIEVMGVETSLWIFTFFNKSEKNEIFSTDDIGFKSATDFKWWHVGQGFRGFGFVSNWVTVFIWWSSGGYKLFTSISLPRFSRWTWFIDFLKFGDIVPFTNCSKMA